MNALHLEFTDNGRVTIDQVYKIVIDNGIVTINAKSFPALLFSQDSDDTREYRSFPLSWITSMYTAERDYDLSWLEDLAKAETDKAK